MDLVGLRKASPRAQPGPALPEIFPVDRRDPVDGLDVLSVDALFRQGSSGGAPNKVRGWEPCGMPPGDMAGAGMAVGGFVHENGFWLNFRGLHTVSDDVPVR
ncbi:hypothetical protein ACFYYH_08770 [Streptomyces sp. NPDC002018]|uniref:hypothetical protein n=1 Tax=Streptomyces sp. NPDC002018 TaxID=3364629 RepID=UPI0036C4A56B